MRTFKPSRNTPKPRKNTPTSRISIGIHAVKEALSMHSEWVTELWVREGFGASPQEKAIEDLVSRRQIKVTTVNSKKLEDLGSGHQGVAALISQAPELDPKALDQEKVLGVALDQVVDPHNLGAVVRTAWLFGAAGVWTTKDRSAPITPTVSKVAQGGLEHVPILAASALDQEFKYLKSKGFWIFGLSHKATSTLYDVKLPEKVLWVLGAEGSGLRKSIERACDELVLIPQASVDASFNVSVAAGVAMAESVRQQGPFFRR